MECMLCGRHDSSTAAAAAQLPSLQRADKQGNSSTVSSTIACAATAAGKELPGLLGGFFDLLVYCVNGAVATDLPERCKEAYRSVQSCITAARWCGGGGGGGLGKWFSKPLLFF
jgi:hypothetical protein